MTIMARLHKKGLLVRRREGKTDYYAPAYERDQYMALRAQSEVEGLVEQYGDVALSHFAQQMASLDPARRRALQRLAASTELVRPDLEEALGRLSGHWGETAAYADRADGAGDCQQREHDRA